MSSFGENLKQIRLVKNISQGKLADLMNIHATHISRYERNLTIPSIDVVKKLADVLEVSTDDLVYGNLEEKAGKKIQDAELLNIFSKAQNLDKQDKDCIKSLLKAFIFQKEMQRQLVS